MFYRVTLLLLLSTIFLQASIKEFQNLKTLQSKFIQTITSSSNTKIDYKGELFIKNSGKILWSYQEPVRKDVFVNGSEVIINEPDLEQAIITKLDKEIDMLKMLNEAKKIDENIYSSKIDNTEYKIVLKNGKIDKILYKDEIENSVEIKFIDTILDVEISDSKFIFNIPLGYDLIRK